MLQIFTPSQFGMWRDTLFLDKDAANSGRWVRDVENIGDELVDGGRTPIVVNLSHLERFPALPQAEISLGQDVRPITNNTCTQVSSSTYYSKSKSNELDTGPTIAGLVEFNSGSSSKTEWGTSLTAPGVGGYSASGWTSKSHGYSQGALVPANAYYETWENTTEKRIYWFCTGFFPSQDFYAYTLEVTSFNGPNSIPSNRTPPACGQAQFNFSQPNQYIERSSGANAGTTSGANVARNLFGFSGQFESQQSNGARQRWVSSNGTGILMYCGTDLVSATRIEAK